MMNLEVGREEGSHNGGYEKIRGGSIGEKYKGVHRHRSFLRKNLQWGRKVKKQLRGRDRRSHKRETEEENMATEINESPIQTVGETRSKDSTGCRQNRS